MKSHKDLEAWKQSMDMVKEIYEITGAFPKEELYSLTSQIRRSAVSIPSNLAEGAGRSGKKEFAQFCSISLGSLSELETQILISKKLNYIEDITNIIDQLIVIRRLISGLRNSLLKRE